jgi:hypothetical protein
MEGRSVLKGEKQEPELQDSDSCFMGRKFEDICPQKYGQPQISTIP